MHVLNKNERSQAFFACFLHCTQQSNEHAEWGNFTNTGPTYLVLNSMSLVVVRKAYSAAHSENLIYQAHGNN